MNNAEVQHIFNPSKVTELVNTAIDAWCEKNPTATVEEVIAKRAEIATNITASRIKDKFLNSKANRAARRQHISEEVVKHGLQFTTGSRLIQVADLLEFDDKDHEKAPFLTGLLEDFVNTVIKPMKLHEQAVTFCFKSEDLGYGMIGAKVAMSFQNPEDEPDSLVAREYALARFLSGKHAEAVFRKDQIDQVGLHPAIRNALVQTGIVDAYFDEFVQPRPEVEAETEAEVPATPEAAAA